MSGVLNLSQFWLRIPVMATAPEDLRVDDDGLLCPDVRRWAETKYRLVSLYDELFSKGMKFKWKKRVYIDLYSAAGYSRVKGTNMVLNGSPVLALTVSRHSTSNILRGK
jgi:hypothetical protein